MDSDDISVPERCERQLAFMKAGRLDVSGGVVAEFSHSTEEVLGRRVLPVTHEALVRFARRRNPLNHPCVMFRKSRVEAAGGYRAMPLFEDYDLWIRMIMKGARLGNMEETLLYMRSGRGMINRRGGMGYAKAAWAFGWAAYREGFVGRLGGLRLALGRIGAALLPAGARAGVYRRWLREA
jgi:hypothetical protein